MKTISLVEAFPKPRPLSTNHLSTITFTTLDEFVRASSRLAWKFCLTLFISFPFPSCPAFWPQSPLSSQRTFSLRTRTPTSSLICRNSLFASPISNITSTSFVLSPPLTFSFGPSARLILGGINHRRCSVVTRVAERELHRNSRVGITSLFAPLARRLHFAILRCSRRV